MCKDSIKGGHFFLSKTFNLWKCTDCSNGTNSCLKTVTFESVLISVRKRNRRWSLNNLEPGFFFMPVRERFATVISLCWATVDDPWLIWVELVGVKWSPLKKKRKRRRRQVQAGNDASNLSPQSSYEGKATIKTELYLFKGTGSGVCLPWQKEPLSKGHWPDLCWKLRYW